MISTHESDGLQTSLNEGFIEVCLEFESPTEIINPNVAIVVKNQMGERILGGSMKSLDQMSSKRIKRAKVNVKVIKPPLNSDSYSLSVYLADGDFQLDFQEDTLRFDYIGERETQYYQSIPIFGSVSSIINFQLESI